MQWHENCDEKLAEIGRDATGGRLCLLKRGEITGSPSIAQKDCCSIKITNY